MDKIISKTTKPLKGEITVPGDKSISHRGVMFGAISDGITELSGFLDGADCRSTISCFKQMGIDISQNDDHVIIYGKGLYGLKESRSTLDTGNSGTTTRLISGILSGQPFTTRLTGDASIEKRPMKRIMEPLTMMGADIRSERDNGCAPLIISHAALHGIDYASPVASAQVKSCILLAGLYADSPTSVTEPVLSRDHTERMLRGFGADITSNGKTASIKPAPILKGQSITIPGDISSAAYWITAALIVPGSELLIKNVNTNPTRAGILSVYEKMGASIERLNEREVSGEPVADLLVKYSDLSAVTVEGDIIPALIDELPVIAVAAAAAKGTTYVRDASELAVKESDRITVVTENLRAMGADIDSTEDGWIINGGNDLKGAHIRTCHDHRIAMSFAIAGLISQGETTFDDPACIDISYPTFFDTLYGIQ